MNEPVERLFRRESGRIVATVARIFGVQNLALAEDVTQEAFCRALEVWKFRGMPDNAAAWLMATAKNCALDVLRRERTARSFAPELSELLRSEWTLAPTVEELFATGEIKDDLLRMMFSCCHPRLSEPAQLALILNILCGFSIDEVASAFLTARPALEKRVGRAKKVLAQSNTLFDVRSPQEYAARLPVVHRALYLLFNEGYHGASPNSAVRSELCAEAIRLAQTLLDHPLGATPTTQALAALMYLNAARLPARTDHNGYLHGFLDQDRSHWDQELIARGLHLLELSARGSELSPYHVEAAIASIHATTPEAASTDWPRIVALYDALLAVRPSPIVELNRAIAVAESEGPDQGLKEIAGIADQDRLRSYPFYPAALGELELRRGQVHAARAHFSRAHVLARNAAERHFLEQRIRACESDTDKTRSP